MEPIGDRITPLVDAERRFPIPISGTTVVKTKFPRSRIIRPDENRPTAHAPGTGGRRVKCQNKVLDATCRGYPNITLAKALYSDPTIHVPVKNFQHVMSD